MQGSMDNFLQNMTLDEWLGGKNKKIYLIKDECHVATNNLDTLSNDYFEKIRTNYKKISSFIWIYASGGFLFCGLFYTFNLSLKKKIIISGGIGVFYAISDEIHQLFVKRQGSDKFKMYGLIQLESYWEYVFSYLLKNYMKKLMSE